MLHEIYYFFHRETTIIGESSWDEYYIQFPGTNNEVQVRKQTYYDVLSMVEDTDFKQIGETTFEYESTDDGIFTTHVYDGYCKLW